MATQNFEEDFAEDFEEGTEPDKPPPNNRRGARQVALQVLYWDTSSPGTASVALQELTQRFALSTDVSNFSADLVHHVGEHDRELGDLIAANATHWKQDRIARIDWIILRLALAEMLYLADIPVRVSIDEAIELAKLYSTEQSYGFINGILDAIVRQRGLPV
jgi:N utilization substance protein B